MQRSDLYSTYSLDPAMVVMFKPARILDTGLIHEMTDSLKQLAGSAHEALFVFDFSRVGYLSSSALGMLLGLQREFAAKGRQMKLAALSDENRELFRITKLESVFDIYPDAKAAIEAFRKHE
jgi:anti-sigma B factor antagonist